MPTSWGSNRWNTFHDDAGTLVCVAGTPGSSLAPQYTKQV
jgi:hypothetical protein